MFDQAFINEVVALALQVAKCQRNEDHLQSVDILIPKFHAECKELAEAENKWDEIPDIMYYAACLQAQGEGFARVMARARLAELYIPEEQAKAACLAKYRRRAAGLPKDIEAERTAILEAVEGVRI